MRPDAPADPPAAPPPEDPPAAPISGEAELIIDGQEEVFSRTAVELGRIEHHYSEETLPPGQADDMHRDPM